LRGTNVAGANVAGDTPQETAMATDEKPVPKNALDYDSGTASARHKGRRRPDDDHAVADALHKVGAAERGRALEDHLRDRYSMGVAGGHDDSIDRDHDA
jgi:hypothetical protein